MKAQAEAHLSACQEGPKGAKPAPPGLQVPGSLESDLEAWVGAELLVASKVVKPTEAHKMHIHT